MYSVMLMITQQNQQFIFISFQLNKQKIKIQLKVFPFIDTIYEQPSHSHLMASIAVKNIKGPKYDRNIPILYIYLQYLQQQQEEMQPIRPSFARQTQYNHSESFFSCMHCCQDQHQDLILREKIDKLRMSNGNNHQKYSMKSMKHSRKISNINPQERSLKSSYSQYLQQRQNINFSSHQQYPKVNYNLINQNYPLKSSYQSHHQIPSLMSKDSIRTTNQTYNMSNIRFSQHGYQNIQRIKGLSSSNLKKKTSINFYYKDARPTQALILPSAHKSQPDLKEPNQPQKQDIIHPPILNNSILFGIDENLYENQASMMSYPSQKQQKNVNFQSKQIISSLQLNKKLSNQSQSQSHRLKHKRSINEVCFNGKLKVRQTCSIQSKAESEDHVSYVITDSMINSDLMLMPIQQHEWAQKSFYYN